MIQTAEIKKRSGARPHRPVLASVICAHRNNLETHTRTIGVTAPIVNHRSIRSRRAPRRHPSLTKCELAEGSSAGNFRRSLFTGLDWRDLGSSSSSARGVRSGSQIDLGELEKRRRRRRRLLSPADALPRAASRRRK